MITDPQTAADAAERVQRWLDEWSFKVQSNLVVTGCGRTEPDGCTELTAPDIDALLADRARIAAELEQANAATAEQRAETYWLVERGEEMRDALTVAIELIDRLARSTPCDIDHNGHCVPHRVREAPLPCPHPLGRRFVEAWRVVQSEATERPGREGAEKGPESHGEARNTHRAPLALFTPEEALQGAPGADGLCDSRVHRDFADGQDIRCQLPAGHAAHRNGTQEWTP